MMLAILALLPFMFLLYNWTILPLPPSPLQSNLWSSAHQLASRIFGRRKSNATTTSAPSSEKPWIMYSRWSKKLGPVITLPTVGSTSIIVINTAKAASELLDRRPTFSDKPRWVMAELLGRQNNVGFQYYGERLKASRRVLQASLNAREISTTWNDLLDSQTMQLVRKIAENPQDFYESVNGQMQDLVVRFTYGRQPDPAFINTATQIMKETGAALQPGRWMVNQVPILRYIPSWVPGAGFKNWAAEARRTFMDLTRSSFNKTKAEMKASDDSTNCFVKHALQSFNSNAPKTSHPWEDVVMTCAGSLFSAGSETTASTILSFILLMTHHPEIQERAHKEIMNVVGLGRLPNLQDRKKLPYVDCIIQEVHRFNPAIPLVTHSNSTADEYEGHRIPKKSWLMANVWHMLHDDKNYVDPASFNPDRFWPEPGASYETDPRQYVYGFGRRRCPGMHFADATVFLAASRLLTLFTMGPIKGNAPPPLLFKTGLVPAPELFRCDFTLRPQAEELLGTA